MASTASALLALLLLGAAYSPQTSATAPAGMEPDRPCTEAANEQSGVRDLPPIQVARCAYSRTELIERFGRLLESRAPRLELEAVEEVFGLPRLYTRLGDARSAWYDIRLRGGAAGSEWEAWLNFRESFFPLYAFRLPRLRGAGRATPILEGDHGTIYLSLRLQQPTPRRGAPDCIPVSGLLERALRAGWTDETQSASFATHGGPKSVMLSRRDMTYFPGIHTQGHVASPAELEAACFMDGRIDQEPTRPEPPLSAEERAMVERRSREAIAREVDARWRALPATGEEDRQARDARADFMRDQELRRGGLQYNQVADAIAALTPEQLREFARRIATGSYLHIGRNQCELAVREPDPVAALARYASAQGLNAAEAGVVHYYCFLYVEGRRYRYRSLLDRVAPQAPTEGN